MNTASGGGSTSTQDVDFIFKVILVGNSGVGKTSLTERFVDNRFSSGVLSTIAVDFKVHVMAVENKKVKIQIWDTAGAERFRSVARSFYRGANAVMLCYDVSDRQSYEDLNTWFQEVTRSVLPATPCIAVACKCDLTEGRVVSQQEGISLAEKLEIGYIETSAKENTNVTEAFKYIAQKAIHDSVSACHDRLNATNRQPQTHQLHSPHQTGRDASGGQKSKGCC